MQQGRILCAAALDESVLLTAGESTVSLSKEMSPESWLSTGAQTLPLLLFVCPLLRVSYSLMQNNEQEKYLCDIYIA